ncbi:prostaglandin reductase 1 [Apis florea]|uniref:prostaglandin reductase 1 n=1 Tax=Apis florea TaxID=7463 RepID=UPI000252CA85|nr:prostaglandin reductase 1 [Apis florea]
MIKARKFIVLKHFNGKPQKSDLQLIEEELPSLQNGEFLIQAEYLSVDPYMRVYMLRYPVGSIMLGSQIGKIIESKNSNFPVGKKVIADVGWRSHTIVNPFRYNAEYEFRKPRLLRDIEDLPMSLYLGMLGMPGNTAYFGLLEICKPKKGETLVISGAGGAVGSHVGQIGKILGLTVVGIAGSDEKCKWLVKELGFDHAINYKEGNLDVALRKAIPKGIDCYFDNVGGDISSIVMYQMKLNGRVAVCGSISSYHADALSLPKATILQPTMVFNELKVEGFLVSRWDNRWNEGIEKNLQWIREKKIRYHETIVKGFDNMFDAFVEMLEGKNIGKAIVQV